MSFSAKDEEVWTFHRGGSHGYVTEQDTWLGASFFVFPALFDISLANFKLTQRGNKLLAISWRRGIEIVRPVNRTGSQQEFHLNAGQ